jgi:hypothetical protein
MQAKGAIGLLSALLLCALVAVAVYYVRATRPLYYPQDEALVARATQAAADHFGTTAKEIRGAMFPIVMRLSKQTCVELRAKRSGLGGYLACYRLGGEQMMEERVSGAPFGSRRFFPPLL